MKSTLDREGSVASHEGTQLAKKSTLSEAPAEKKRQTSNYETATSASDLPLVKQASDELAQNTSFQPSNGSAPSAQRKGQMTKQGAGSSTTTKGENTNTRSRSVHAATKVPTSRERILTETENLNQARSQRSFTPWQLAATLQTVAFAADQAGKFSPALAPVATKVKIGAKLLRTTAYFGQSLEQWASPDAQFFQQNGNTKSTANAKSGAKIRAVTSSVVREISSKGQSDQNKTSGPDEVQPSTHHTTQPNAASLSRRDRTKNIRSFGITAKNFSTALTAVAFTADQVGSYVPALHPVASKVSIGAKVLGSTVYLGQALENWTSSKRSIGNRRPEFTAPIAPQVPGKAAALARLPHVEGHKSIRSGLTTSNTGLSNSMPTGALTAGQYEFGSAQEKATTGKSENNTPSLPRSNVKRKLESLGTAANLLRNTTKLADEVSGKTGGLLTWSADFSRNIHGAIAVTTTVQPVLKKLFDSSKKVSKEFSSALNANENGSTRALPPGVDVPQHKGIKVLTPEKPALPKAGLHPALTGEAVRPDTQVSRGLSPRSRQTSRGR